MSSGVRQGSPSSEARWDFARDVRVGTGGTHAFPSSKPPSQAPVTRALIRVWLQAPHVHPAMARMSSFPVSHLPLFCSSWGCPPILQPFLPAFSYQEVCGAQVSHLVMTQTRSKCPRACLVSQWSSSWGYQRTPPPARPVSGSI